MGGAVDVKIEGIGLGLIGDPEMLLKALTGQLPISRTMAGPASAKPSLVDGMMPATGVVMMYGTEGSFKTYVALDLAFHVALGCPWIDHPVRRGDVVYLGAEDPYGLGLRRTAWLLHHGVSESEIDPHFKAIEDAPDFTVRRGKDAANLERLIRFVSPEARLIVIDTAASGCERSRPQSATWRSGHRELRRPRRAAQRDGPARSPSEEGFAHRHERFWRVRP